MRQERSAVCSKEYPAGRYKMRTIIISGQIKLENSCGIEIVTSATYLVQAEFKKVKSK